MCARMHEYKLDYITSLHSISEVCCEFIESTLDVKDWGDSRLRDQEALTSACELEFLVGTIAENRMHLKVSKGIQRYPKIINSVQDLIVLK